MTEHTNYEEFEDYVEPVKGKQSDDISAEVDVNTMFINYGVKTLCSCSL